MERMMKQNENGNKNRMYDQFTSLIVQLIENVNVSCLSMGFKKNAITKKYSKKIIM